MRDLFAWIYDICVVRGHEILKRSDQRGIATTYLVISIVIAVSVVGAASYVLILEGQSSPKFKVSNLTIETPDLTGSSLTRVSADISNVGDNFRTYNVELRINNEIVDNKSVGLDSGETDEVEFEVEVIDSGIHDLKIGETSETFEITPAEFEISNLTVNPKEVEAGNSVEISVVVKNVGGLSEDYPVKLKLDGIIEDTQTVNLSEGETTTVSFYVQKRTEKTFLAEIGGLSQSFKVVKTYAKPSTSDLKGNITEDTLLTTSKSPYTVTENIQVFENVTLKIKPSVTLKFEKGVVMRVGGELIAIGNEDEVITFTSNQTNPSRGDWKSIEFVNSAVDARYDEEGNYVSGSVLAYTEMRYGGRMVHVTQASPFITDSVFEKGKGIHIRYGTGMKIKNNRFENNELRHATGGGLDIVNSENMLIKNNIIKNNTVWAWNSSGGGISLSSMGIEKEEHVIIENNRIVNNTATLEGGGIRIAGTAVIIKGNRILSNSVSEGKVSGIYIQSLNDAWDIYYDIRINGNNFNDNGEYEIYRGSDFSVKGIDIDATNNYWGTTDKNEIKKKIYDYYDDISLGKVIFEPIATEPF